MHPEMLLISAPMVVQPTLPKSALSLTRRRRFVNTKFGLAEKFNLPA